MEQNLSIFNFRTKKWIVEDLVRAKRWLVTLFLAAIGTLIVSVAMLRWIFPVPPEWPQGSEILFLGSSHTQRGSPFEVPWFPWTVGRVAVGGADASITGAAALKYAEDRPELDLVVIEIDEFTLYTDTVKVNRGDLSTHCWRAGLNVLELPSRSVVPYASIKAANLVMGRGINLFSKHGRLTTHNFDNLVERWSIDSGSRRGYGDLESKEWAVQEARSRLLETENLKPTIQRRKGLELTLLNAKRRVRGVTRRAGVPDFNIQAVARLAKVMHDRGVGLAFIRYPKHELYLGIRPDEWDVVLGLARKTAEVEVGQDIPCWDFQETLSLADWEFRDISHVNHYGRRRLAVLVGEQILARNYLAGRGED